MERRMGDGWGDGAERYMGARIRGNGGSMNGETDGGWMG